MSDPHSQTGDAPTGAAPADAPPPPAEPGYIERCIPALFLPFTCLMPRTIGAKTARVPFAIAVLIHASFWVFGFFSLFWIGAWLETAFDNDDLLDVFPNFERILGGIFRSFDSPLEIATFFFVVFLNEMFFLAAGLFMAVWGARDEPVYQTILAGLQRFLLYFPLAFVLPMILFTVGMAVFVAIGGWLRDIGERLFANSWDGDDMLFVNLAGLFFFAMFLWLLWTWFRFLGGPRPNRAGPATETFCEICGYNLMHMDISQSCPECGSNLSLSLAPTVRPGPPLAQAKELGRARAIFQTIWMPLLRPGAFGRLLQTRSNPTAHRWFLAGHLGAILVALPVMILATVVIISIFEGWPGEEMWLFIPAMTMAIFAYGLPFVLAIVFFTATVSGLIWSFVAKRNLLSVSMQAVCYLGPLLCIWVLLLWVLFILVVLAEIGQDILTDLADRLGADEGFLVFGAWVAFMILMLVIYMALTSRIVRAARYANK